MSCLSHVLIHHMRQKRLCGKLECSLGDIEFFLSPGILIQQIKMAFADCLDAEITVLTLEHMLLTCKALAPARAKFSQFKDKYLHENGDLEDLLAKCLATKEIQFWLDASPLPLIISALQLSGENVFNCFSS